MNNPQLYSKNNREQDAGAEKFIKIIGEFLRLEFDDDKVALIDIGSGCGKVLVETIIKKSQLNFSKVVGVDISMDMVKHSNKSYGNDLISFDVMNAEGSIPYSLRNQQFDLATSVYSLHWIKDMKTAFSNINELLNLGGLFCCVFLQSHLIFDIWDALEDKYHPYMNWREKFSSLCRSENSSKMIRKYLYDCGFETIIFLDSKKEKFSYKTADHFAASMLAVNPCLKSMPNDLREEFVSDHLRLVESMCDDSQYAIPITLFYFVARKVNGC